MASDRISGDDSFDRKLLSPADFAILVGGSEASIKEAVSNGSLLAVQRTNPDGSIESGVAGFQARPEIQGAHITNLAEFSQQRAALSRGLYRARRR